MKIDWDGQETIIKEDVEVLKECISCSNANRCASELKQGQIMCISLYAMFTDDKKIKEILEKLLED